MITNLLGRSKGPLARFRQQATWGSRGDFRDYINFSESRDFAAADTLGTCIFSGGLPRRLAGSIDVGPRR